MMESPKTPDVAELREILSGLLGDVVVREGKPAAEAPDDCLATFVDDDGDLAAVCVVDFGVAVAAGAAIAMMPVGVAEEARDGGKLPASLRDNLREVTNVMATLLCGEETPHVKLGKLYSSRSEAPADAVGLAARASKRLDVEVSVGEYGRGTLSLLIR